MKAVNSISSGKKVPSATHSVRGFTLIELVIVITIIGILAVLGSRSISRSLENRKFLATRAEMDVLKTALVGDPGLKENGIRTYFGYIGDIGELPPDLDALVTNPYTSNPKDTLWSGPYVEVDFEAELDEFKRDAWGADYQYIASTGGTPDSLQIRSKAGGSSYTGSESYSVGFAKQSMLENSVHIRVYSSAGVNLDTSSVSYVGIKYGGIYHTDWAFGSGQRFHFENQVPIGNRQMKIIALGDTIFQPVSVTPNSDLTPTVTVYPNYGVLRLNDSGAAPPESQGTSEDSVRFTVENTGQETYHIRRITITWSNGSCWNEQTPYLAKVTELSTGGISDVATYWDYSADNSGVRVGSGSEIELRSTWDFPYGDTGVRLVFRDEVTGTGTPINMSDVSFKVQLTPLIASKQTVSFETPLANCDPPNLIEYSNSVADTTLTINFDNQADLTAYVQAMTPTWTGSTMLLKQIEVSGGTDIWTGLAASGDKCYFTSEQAYAGTATRTGAQTLLLRFEAGSTVTGRQFYIKMHLNDGSTQTMYFST